MVCNHEKSFKGDIILPTLPAKIPWECIKCGAKGYDIERSPSKYRKDSKGTKNMTI